MSQLRAAYTLFQSICHWIIAVLCAFAFPTAQAMKMVHMGRVFGIRGSALDRFLAPTHEWGGWVILALTVLLLFSRFRNGVPALPRGMRTWQRVAAHIAHSSIYVGLIALVASGASAMYVGVLGSAHIILTKVGLGLIGLHVAAVGWHQLVRRDGLMGRMLPAPSYLRRIPERTDVSPNE